MIEGLDIPHQIKFSPLFLKDNPYLEKAQWEEQLLTGGWIVPTKKSGVYLPWMGSTAHQAMPSGLELNCMGHKTVVGVFAKPFKPEELVVAESEMKNIATALRRNILTPPAIAILQLGEEGHVILLTKLIRNLVPLSALDLSFSCSDTRSYDPHTLLEDVVSFLAEIHNKGIVHLDAHTGQVAFKFRPVGTPQMHILDLETAQTLDDIELASKKKGDYLSPESQEKFRKFERFAILDLGIFAGYLHRRGFPLGPNRMLQEITGIYQETRDPTFGLLSGHELEETLQRDFMGTLKVIPYRFLDGSLLERQIKRFTGIWRYLH